MRKINITSVTVKKYVVFDVSNTVPIQLKKNSKKWKATVFFSHLLFL